MFQLNELALKLFAVSAITSLGIFQGANSCFAQFEGEGPINDGPPPVVIPTPPPPPTPPPIPNTPPPTFTPPPPNNPFVPPIVVPSDVTQTSSFPGFAPVFTPNGLASPAIRGVQQLPLASFPAQNVKPSKNSKIFVFLLLFVRVVFYVEISNQ